MARKERPEAANAEKTWKRTWVRDIWDRLVCSYVLCTRERWAAQSPSEEQHADEWKLFLSGLQQLLLSHSSSMPVPHSPGSQPSNLNPHVSCGPDIPCCVGTMWFPVCPLRDRNVPSCLSACPSQSLSLRWYLVKIKIMLTSWSVDSAGTLIQHG